ncbi:MAG: outer membrane beta-barrel domain-containing protein [Bdellovibrionales bacterium]
MRLKILIAAFFLTSNFVAAQDSDVEELNLIELELDNRSSPQVEAEEEASAANETPRETAKSTSQKIKTDKEVKKIGDLNRLADFKEVSVIQKRYLPRTDRFQLFVGPSITLNDPWFNVFGGTFRGTYNWREAWGLELGYSFLSSEKTQALKELNNENRTAAESIVEAKSYYNIDLNWTPIYGKMTWLDQKIVYYDTYFSLGFGGTEIQTGDSQATIHFGFGQIFSVSKKMAYRWDLSWNLYQAKQIDAGEGTFNNVFLSAGVSFFFPEATYR